MKGYKASLSKINLGAMFILIYALLGLAVRGGMEYIININQHRNTLRFFTTDFISPIYKDFTISLGALILVATSIMLISKVSKAKLVIPSVMMYALMLTNLICDCCEIILNKPEELALIFYVLVILTDIWLMAGWLLFGFTALTADKVENQTGKSNFLLIFRIITTIALGGTELLRSLLLCIPIFVSLKEVDELVDVPPFFVVAIMWMSALCLLVGVFFCFAGKRKPATDITNQQA